MSEIQNFPPDWALDAACAKLNAEAEVAHHPQWGRSTHSGHPTIVAFARYIAEHEEAPVDPLYEALKAVVELGRYDTRKQTELLRGELKQRGLQIVEVKP